MGRPLSSVLICGEFSLRFLTGLCGMVKAQPLLPALETSVKKGRMPEIWRDQGERPTRSCCSTTFKGAGCVRRQKRVSVRTCWWNGIQCQSGHCPTCRGVPNRLEVVQRCEGFVNPGNQALRALKALEFQGTWFCTIALVCCFMVVLYGCVRGIQLQGTAQRGRVAIFSHGLTRSTQKLGTINRR